MNEADRVEHYRELQREATKAGRWSYAGSIALVACLVIAAQKGPADGWPWAMGAIFALAMLLWALIDVRHYVQLIAIHLLPRD